MVCKKCANKISSGEKFCGNCGSEITEAELQNQTSNVQQVNDVDSKEEELVKNAKRGFSLGLWSIIAWLLPLAGYPVTICGIVYSIKGLDSKTKGNKALAGLILSIIFLILTLINSIAGAILNLRGQLN